MGWQVVTGIGRLLVAFGTVVILFVAYLLWGTNISAASHQRALHSQFEHDLAEQHSKAPSPSPTSTTTTVPHTPAQQLAAGVAPPDGDPIAVIRIPRIGLDRVVVQGTATHDLQLGPGHYDGTPLPGQVGNVAIAGHRTTYGAPFFDLSDLQKGDTITLTTLQGTFSYSVVRSLIVSPSNVSVLDPSTTAMLTLTTCNPRFSASQRLVVQADLTSVPAPAPPPVIRPATKAPASGNLAGTQGPWAGAFVWGVAALALASAAWLVARRRSRARRWLTYGATVLPMLLLLYFFFENANALLPASF